MRSLILLGILILNIGAFAAQQSWPEKQKYNFENCVQVCRVQVARQVSPTALQILHGSAEFSSKLVQEIVGRDEKNFIVSSLGALLALSKVSFVAGGNSANELQKTLGLPVSTSEREEGLKSIVDSLKSYQTNGLEVANGVFLSSSYEVKDDFDRSILAAFGTPIRQLDFKNFSGSTLEINKWCKKATHERIHSVVGEKGLPKSTALVLVNALYLKGKWLNAFNNNKPWNNKFWLPNNTRTEIPMMAATLQVLYGEDYERKFKFIELPYMSEDANHGMSMYIILPKDPENYTTLETNIHKIKIEDLRKRGKSRAVSITLPKFKIESEFNLNDPLKKIGVKTVFDEHSANFPGIFSSYGNDRLPALHIDRVIQKVSIEVTEEGNPPGPLTDEPSPILLVDSGPSLYAHRPFFFIIGTTGENPVNLFTGCFTGLD